MAMETTLRYSEFIKESTDKYMNFLNNMGSIWQQSIHMNNMLYMDEIQKIYNRTSIPN